MFNSHPPTRFGAVPKVTIVLYSSFVYHAALITLYAAGVRVWEYADGGGGGL